MDGTATVEIDSSIIAQADAPVFAADVVLADGPGGEIFASGSNNLIRTQVGFPTVLKSDPLLGPLANNGGPTPTHALASNSPAINEGANPRSLATDQRGASYQRVAGGRADIGAFELQMVPGPILLGDYNGNSVVDAADYVIWRKTLGMQVALFAGADGSGNGEIDTADYDVWRGNFGASNPAAATGTARSVVASGLESLAAEEHSAKANAIMALPPPAFFQLPRSNGRIPVSLHQAATLRTSLLLNAALLDALTDASAADETSDESPRRPQHDSAAEAELTGDVRLVERIWKDWELLFDL
jgi:hypothetical protein